jgi:hypothetical protein
MTEQNLTPLYKLSDTIQRECRDKAWFAYAKPYVQAMGSLDSVKDYYYSDSGVSICLYALSNLTYWRGEVARQVKAEIKRHIESNTASHVAELNRW